MSLNVHLVKYMPVDIIDMPHNGQILKSGAKIQKNDEKRAVACLTFEHFY